MASIDCVIVTCEHASHRVPSRYRALFRDQEAVLKTHRGSDLGALWLARELATALEAPLFTGSVSRPPLQSLPPVIQCRWFSGSAVPLAWHPGSIG